MKKKLTIVSAIILCITIVLTIVIVNPFESTPVLAEGYRNGYKLSPTHFDTTGLNPESKFILESEDVISKESIEKGLIIVKQSGKSLNNSNNASTNVLFTVTELSKKKFTITPSYPLERNKIYTIIFTDSSGNEAKWAFQTSLQFAISGSLPADKTDNVPVNTGIEMSFTHSGVNSEISNYFEITPSAKGSFEYHGRTVVFVPDSLEKGTIYTVTIKKGLSLSNSDQKLEEDFSFSFETSANDPEKENNVKGYINYSSFLNEFSSNEDIIIPINYNMNREYRNEADTFELSTEVFTYTDVDAFITALEKTAEVPTWARYYSSTHQPDTSGLTSVLTTSETFPTIRDYDMQPNISLGKDLKKGFYIVVSKWEDLVCSTFIQVTDHAMYLSTSETETIVWLNSIATGQGIHNAQITILGTDLNYITDEKGISRFTTPEIDEANPSSLLKVISSDDVSILPLYSNIGYYSKDMHSYYWSFLTTDRTLYKPNDEVNFWGFLKNRYISESVDKVTVEINQGGYYNPYDFRNFSYLPFMSEPLVTKDLDLSNGFFDGSFTLPYLDPGGYNISVKIGDSAVINQYIKIENYLKPSYKLDVTANKKAIFVNEPVQYDINASFFEGTGLPELDIRYNIGGVSSENGKLKTDSQGIAKLSYTPSARSEEQGIQHLWFSASAEMPESGQINANHNVQVFINDINVKNKGEINDKIGTLSVEVNNITLDKINAGTSEGYDDYLGKAVNKQTFNGKIIKHTWEKKEVGTYYDYINKVTQKRYEYNEIKNTIDTFSITTDSEGKGTYSFTLPQTEECSYTAEYTTIDGNGRTMRFNSWFGRPYTPYSYEDNNYMIGKSTEKADINETVKISMLNNEKPVVGKAFMFIKSQNGIRDIFTSNNNEISFIYTKEDIPNVYMTGIMFDGKAYKDTYQENIAYNVDRSKIILDAKMDKTSYEPGETCTVEITAKDSNGNPIAANINLSIVDEALFKLREMNLDTLSTLYNEVGSGIINTYISHQNNNRFFTPYIAYGKGGVLENAIFDVARSGSPQAEMDMKSALNITFNEATASTSAYIRKEFKDTAIFKSLQLDKDGKGTLSFKLPDNITAWRINLAGISQDLMAGSNAVELKVSLPFFINWSVNNMYLAGDIPYLGVTAYGDSLMADETIQYVATCNELPEFSQKLTGKAFERINIPLFALKAGEYTIKVTAVSKSGSKDAFEQKLKVYNTYHEIQNAVYEKLDKNTNIKAGEDGLTTIYFTDEGKGKYLPSLYSLAYSGGKRIDQQFIALSAQELLNKYFNAELEKTELNTRDYQREDGGLSILPYSQSDIYTTSNMTELVKGSVNEALLKTYLYYYSLQGSASGRSAALYGLATLGEPVLIELEDLRQVKNISLRDKIYLALAYNQIGETFIANEIFSEEVSPILEVYNDYIRISQTVSDKENELSKSINTKPTASETSKDGLSNSEQQSNASEPNLSSSGSNSSTAKLEDALSVETTKVMSTEVSVVSNNDRDIIPEPVPEEEYNPDKNVLSKEAENVELTALAMILAERLNRTEADKMFAYLNSSYKYEINQEVLLNVYKFLFIKDSIDELNSTKVAVTYTYDGKEYTKTVENGYAVSIKIPSIKIGDLKINKVEGDAAVVSVFSAPLEGINNKDSHITLNRKYYNYNGKETKEFKQNDIVKVVIDWDIDSNAIDNYYQITDYVPSGLKPIESPWNSGIRTSGHYYYFRDIDGQKVTFNVYRDSKNKDALMYYARVISPGEFTAEGTIAQGVNARDSIQITERDTIIISDK